MRNRISGLLPGQPDPDLLNRLFFVQQVCLILIVQMGGMTLCARLSSGLRSLLPEALTTMPALPAIAVLLCALSLFLSESERSALSLLLGRGAAACAACAAIASLFLDVVPSPAGIGFSVSSTAGGLTSGSHSLLFSAAFFLVANILYLVRSTDRTISAITDGLACVLSLLVMILVMDFLFSAFQTGTSTSAEPVSPETLTCLLLLSVVALLRRAEYGILSFFLGYGMGSRIGRAILPALLVLPFLLEIGRAHLIDAHAISVHYTSAVLTASATVVSIALLFIVASHINKMQSEIQDLGLRDELTGLYNVRGFYLLAEQSLLLAKRAQQQFGVLFIDLDNLKQINDSYGHTAGSTLLVEMARMLDSTFRETDVIGRVGGDEFLVAGQFEQGTIVPAIERLKACAGACFPGTNRRFPLSFSMGYAPILDPQETLKEMVVRADQAMYDNKRQKKLLATV
jgi:diguanylate cyclase (GGDEF)-like protein